VPVTYQPAWQGGFLCALGSGGFIFSARLAQSDVTTS